MRHDVLIDQHGHHRKFARDHMECVPDAAPDPSEIVAAADALGIPALDIAGALLEGDQDADTVLRSSDPAAIEAVAGLFRWLWGNVGTPERRVRAAFVRFIGVSLIVRPDLTGDLRMAEIGKALAITKAAVSLGHVEMGAKLNGARAPAGRSGQASDAYAESARRGWVHRRANNGKQQPPPQPPPRPRYSPAEFAQFLLTLDPEVREEAAQSKASVGIAWRGYEKAMLDYQGQLTEWTSKQTTKKA